MIQIIPIRCTFTDIALGAYVWNDKSMANICCSLREKSHNDLIILGGSRMIYTSSGLENLYLMQMCLLMVMLKRLQFSFTLKDLINP
jgi:hypothetical protein